MSLGMTILVVFITDLIFWLTIEILNRRLSLKDLPTFFSQVEYSYLVQVNTCAAHMLEMGSTQDEVAQKLPKVPFNFLMEQSSKKKYQEAALFVKEVLADRNLVKAYLVNYGLDKDSFQALCRDFKKSRDEKETVCLIKEIFKPLNIDAADVISLIARWQSVPFIAKRLSDDTEYTITKGKNQLILFKAMESSVLKAETTQKDFVQMMQSIKRLHPTMQVVTAAAMSQHVISKADEMVVEAVKAEILKSIPLSQH